MNQLDDATLETLVKLRSSWMFDRALTLDLLDSMSPSDLLWSPGESVGPFWKQFRHVGRVQEDYIDALKTKTVSFSCAHKRYHGGPSRPNLSAYLKQQDALLFQALDSVDLTQPIDWFGDEVCVPEHLLRLAAHETLHHGQWIVYCRLLGMTMPESWSIWGL